MPAPPAALNSSEDVAGRVRQLEAETQSLRAEVQRLREQPVRLPPVDAPPPGPTAPAPAPAAGPYAAAPAATPGLTMAEVDTEIKKFSWKKGDFTIVPYGCLWGNMVDSTERTSPGPYTLWACSGSNGKEDEFYIDARNTRLGFDVLGPEVPLFGCAKSGGKVEIDFQQTVLSTENKASVLLRHAYAEVKDEDFRLLAGQTWDVISPLFPCTLNYSVGWDAGDIGYRRAQIRGERYFHLSDTS
ncbi:MAG: hypothetical protein ABFC96_08540, partial [Thermoguttaceae bacterium]